MQNKQQLSKLTCKYIRILQTVTYFNILKNFTSLHLSCKHFLSEHFAENGTTLWCTVAKLWCLNFVQFSGTPCPHKPDSANTAIAHISRRDKSTYSQSCFLEITWISGSKSIKILPFCTGNMHLDKLGYLSQSYSNCDVHYLQFAICFEYLDSTIFNFDLAITATSSAPRHR